MKKLIVMALPVLLTCFWLSESPVAKQIILRIANLFDIQHIPSYAPLFQ